MFSFKQIFSPFKLLQSKPIRFFSYENVNLSHKHSLFFSHENVLENQNIKLIPLHESHISILRPILLDNTLWMYNPNFACGNEEELKNYIDKALDQKIAQKRYPFVIMNKNTKKCNGTTSFYNLSFENEVMAIGYTILGREFQKTGINQNCKFLMLQHAFEDLSFKRVEFYLETLNQHSVVSLLKMGIKHEGILRSNMLTKTRRRRDTTIMSLLDEEWPRVKEKLLKKINRYDEKI